MKGRERERLRMDIWIGRVRKRNIEGERFENKGR